MLELFISKRKEKLLFEFPVTKGTLCDESRISFSSKELAESFVDLVKYGATNHLDAEFGQSLLRYDSIVYCGTRYRFEFVDEMNRRRRVSRRHIQIRNKYNKIRVYAQAAHLVYDIDDEPEAFD